MLYSLYELTHMAVGPLRAVAMAQSAFLRSPLNPTNDTAFVKSVAQRYYPRVTGDKGEE